MAMKYQIAVDDNFHYMDESERDYGDFYETAEEAITAAQKIVDKSLRRSYTDGCTPEELYNNYQGFGDDPFIITDDKSCKFSAWTYAKGRCQFICAEMSDNGNC
jgi:hypothetical protein